MGSNLAEREPRSDLARRWGMTNAQLEVLRRIIHPDAPDDVIELYLAKCRSLGADPSDKVIYVIPRRSNVKDERTGEWRSEIRWQLQGSIDLFRSIAENSGDYAGQLGPFWSNDGETWKDVWLEPVPPRVCKIGVLRQSFKEPLWVTGTYDYYCPRDSKGNFTPGNFWKGEKGAHQLAKCVEELALRKAFPRKLHGVYGSEEMQQAPKPATKLPERKDSIEFDTGSRIEVSQVRDVRGYRPDVADADYKVLPEAVREEVPPGPKPDAYRRKAGIGAVHKLCTERGIPDAAYREALVQLFGVERFVKSPPDDPTVETVVRPTSSVLTVPELEDLWRALNAMRLPEDDTAETQ